MRVDLCDAVEDYVDGGHEHLVDAIPEHQVYQHFVTLNPKPLYLSINTRSSYNTCTTRNYLVGAIATYTAAMRISWTQDIHIAVTCM